MILILGDPRDPHIARVATEVVKRGRKPVVFSRYNRDCRFSARLSGERWTVDLHIGGQRFDIERVSAVWWRHKPFTFFNGRPEEVEGTELFAEREWYQPLQALPHILSGAPVGWINDPQRQLVANLKPVQLSLAAGIGLTVPRTLLSSDKGDVAAFVSDRPSVYKSFSGVVIGKDQFVFTTAIDAATVAGSGEAEIAMAPGIYQDRVRKAYEVRVVIVDDRLFAFRIDSQSSPVTRDDWRRDQTAPIFDTIVLDAAIEGLLRRFMAESGLRFGAIDAIVTPDGGFCFLECNPAGQWLWLEGFTGAPICSAVADALCASPPRGLPSPGASSAPV